MFVLLHLVLFSDFTILIILLISIAINICITITGINMIDHISNCGNMKTIWLEYRQYSVYIQAKLYYIPLQMTTDDSSTVYMCIIIVGRL